MFDIDGVRSAFKSTMIQGNTIHVKHILPHRYIGREEPKENEANKTQKLLHPSRPRINACEDQKDD
jgi:hypothetical protein